MLLHGLSCVSRVFLRFFGSVFHLFEDLEWFNCEKKQQQNKTWEMQSVCEIECLWCMCVYCVSFLQLLSEIHTHTLKHHKTCKNTFVCIFIFLDHIRTHTHFPSVYLERGEKSAVKLKEYQVHTGCIVSVFNANMYRLYTCILCKCVTVQQILEKYVRVCL